MNDRKHLDQIDKIVTRSKAWLVKEKRNDHLWYGLVDNPIASASMALALWSNDFIRQAELLFTGKKKLSKYEQSVWFLYDCCKKGEKVNNINKLICELNETQQSFIVLLASANRIVDEDQIIHFPFINLIDLENSFGSHWGTYGLVADVIRNLPKNIKYLDLLLNKQSHDGSFYGDIILTSLVISLITFYKVPEELAGVSNKALLWLTQGSKRMSPSVCNDLRFWDSAWAVLALNGEYDPIHTLRYFVDKRLSKPISGWSWTTSSDIICLDSTTLVLESLCLEPRNRIVASAISKVRKDLTRLSQEVFEGGNQLCPTFIDSDGRFLETCPIVTARLLYLLKFDNTKTIDHWQGLLQAILDGSKSPWFVDESITVGLFLYYYSKSDVFNQELLKDLIEKVVDSCIDSVEGKLAIVLGLSTYIHHRKGIKVAMKYYRHLDQLVLECINHIKIDGSWLGSEVGVFGFEIYYSDIVFTSSLSVLALNSYKECLEQL